MKHLLIKLTVLFILTSCASNIDENLINNRISVLSYASNLLVSAELNLDEIKLSQAKEVTYWSQSGQNPQNNLPHFLSEISFDNKEKIQKDSGSASNTIQPIYFEGNLCNVSTRGYLRCIDIESKEIKFEIDLRNENEEDYEIIRGGLAYFDDQIALADGYGQIKVFSTIDGALIWEKNISIPILSAPVIYRNYIYFITLDNKIYALNLKNGNIKWSFQTTFEDKKSLFTASPAAIENIIIAPFGNGEIIAFNYDTGDIFWSENASKISSLSNFDIKDITANPVISGDKVYSISSNGRLVASNIVNGSLAWSLEMSGKNSPIISNNQLYIVDNDARLVCVNKLTGQIYWITQLEVNRNGKKSGKKNNWIGPYLINGLLYVLSTHGELLSISPTTSEILSSEKIKISGISINPVILSKNLFIMDNNSNIYKLD